MCPGKFTSDFTCPSVAAPRFGSMELATSKKIAFCIAVVAYCFLFEQQQHPELSALPMGEQLDLLGVSGRSLTSWALIAYSALGPGAFATWLETEGQATIPATQAQVCKLGGAVYCVLG